MTSTRNRIGQSAAQWGKLDALAQKHVREFRIRQDFVLVNACLQQVVKNVDIHAGVAHQQVTITGSLQPAG